MEQIQFDPAVMEQMPIPLLLASGDIVSASNTAAARMFGSFPDGRSLRSLFPPRQASALLVAAQSGLPSAIRGWEIAGRPYTVQVILMERDARFMLAFYPEPEEDNLFSTRMMGALGRELRPPLTLMMATLGLLSARLPEEDPKAAHYMTSLLQSSFRLLRRAGNFTDLSLYLQGEIVLSLQEADFTEFVCTHLGAARDYIEAKGVSLAFETTEPSLRFAFDADKIERMLLNLLAFALSRAGDGDKITVSVSAAEDAAFLKVRFSGGEIPPEQLRSLFDAYGELRPGDGQGLELELPLARAIATLHGGSIILSSGEGQGASVTVSLPRAKPDANLLRDKGIAYDYAGHFSHVMLEFSDALPAGCPLYQSRKNAAQPSGG